MKESAPRGSRVSSAPLESVNDVDRPFFLNYDSETQ